jgi:hypothetical protein
MAVHTGAVAVVLFVQAAWVVLIRPKSWERYGLKSWIEAAKKRLHCNVLAIALANKLARITWAVLNNERKFECIGTNKMSPTGDAKVAAINRTIARHTKTTVKPQPFWICCRAPRPEATGLDHRLLDGSLVSAR